MKIKGHTEIQLTNVKTGEVKTYHDDNMMTNGLAEFMKNHGMLCGTPFTDAVKNDLINTLLGGILLFDSTLTENADNTRLPDGVKMTANAAQGVTHTGDPTELGSYDANESGWQNAAHTVYRHVFTWTTSQGNGRIASACLTSKPHGFVGEGNSTSGKKTTNSDLTMYTYSNSQDLGNTNKALIMIWDNEAYFLDIDTSDDTINITKTHVCDSECDMRDLKNISSAIFEDVISVQNPTSTPLGRDRINHISCRILSNSIVISWKDYPTNRYLVLTFPKNFSSLTSYAEVTQSATSLTFEDLAGFLTADASKLVVAASSKFYTVDLSNLANVVEIVNEGATISKPNLAYSSGKRHYMVTAVYDETLNRIYPVNNSSPDIYLKSHDIYKDDNSMITQGDNSYYNVLLGRRNDYLATINNLSSVVTKDTTQTMKVIYTLTFAS